VAWFVRPGPQCRKPFLEFTVGGLVGVAPGVIAVSMSGELLGLTFLGMALSFGGLTAGASLGWKSPTG